MTTTTIRGISRNARRVTFTSLPRLLSALLDRHQSRQALARMDDRLLADIGVTRDQAQREAAKPFWAD